jgi:2-dehydro-3-deoxyphosphogluconate aldolase/(4S)-4-hydroxy-2-oxoglutarate aldolase
MSVQSIMAIGPVIPVVIIENIDDAIPLVDALAEGGIGTIEIT